MHGDEAAWPRQCCRVRGHYGGAEVVSPPPHDPDARAVAVLQRHEARRHVEHGRGSSTSTPNTPWGSTTRPIRQPPQVGVSIDHEAHRPKLAREVMTCRIPGCFARADHVGGRRPKRQPRRCLDGQS
jgi:hypothetical protein